MAEINYKPLQDFQNNYERSSEPVHNYPSDRHEYEIKPYPSLLNFGDLQVNTQSKSRYINITNIGISEIDINDILVFGDFELVNIPSARIEPFKILELQIRFVPKTVGQKYGCLYIYNNNLSGERMIRLEGNSTLNPPV